LPRKFGISVTSIRQNRSVSKYGISIYFAGNECISKITGQKKGVSSAIAGTVMSYSRMWKFNKTPIISYRFKRVVSGSVEGMNPHANALFNGIQFRDHVEF